MIDILTVLKTKFELKYLLNFSHFFPNNRDTLMVAQLVEALRYNPEGRGFDSRWCHWNFSLT
jgi:hypothetical protein